MTTRHQQNNKPGDGFAHSGTRFVIVAPCYQANSNGIRVLYLLAELLHKLGRDVVLVASDHATADIFAAPPGFKPSYRRLGVDFTCQDVRDADIVVYPDVIPDNPLRATRVVRYLLNRPWLLTGQPLTYGATDFVVSYSAWIDTHAFRLMLANDDRSLFHPMPTADKESLALVYFGKKPRQALTPTIEAFLQSFERRALITRSLPATRSELATLLRKARVLVSADPLTNLCYEATLCNTPTLLTDDDFGTAQSSHDLPTWGFFTQPNDYAAAVAAVVKAYPSYLEVLAGNEARVRRFVAACHEHFSLCLHQNSDGKRFAELNRRYVGVRAELDRLRFELDHRGQALTGVTGSAAGQGLAASVGYGQVLPNRYVLVDGINRAVKAVPPLHAAIRRLLTTVAGDDNGQPLRHRLADRANRTIKKLPFVHALLKKSLAK